MMRSSLTLMVHWPLTWPNPHNLIKPQIKIHSSLFDVQALERSTFSMGFMFSCQRMSARSKVGKAKPKGSAAAGFNTFNTKSQKAYTSKDHRYLIPLQTTCT